MQQLLYAGGGKDSEWSSEWRICRCDTKKMMKEHAKRKVPNAMYEAQSWMALGVSGLDQQAFTRLSTAHAPCPRDSHFALATAISPRFTTLTSRVEREPAEPRANSI
eukprot:IDg5208t1